MAEDHLSEAACLIEQGATYRRRVGLQPIARVPATRFSPGSSRVLSPSISATPLLPLRSGRPLAAGVRRWHALSQGPRRDRSVDRPGARRA